MKRFRLALLVAVMTAVPAIGFAQSTAKAPKAQKPVTATVSGVVKSVSDAAIVITRSNAKGSQETIQLTAATTGKASLKSGDVVSVRYVEANGQRTATAVTVKKAPKKSAR